MSASITWRFEDTPLWFSSTPERLNAHINKARRDLEVHPDTKIIYKDDRFTSTNVYDQLNDADNFQITPVAKSKKNNSIQTNNMSSVSDLVEQPVNTPSPIPTPTPNGNFGSIGWGPGL